MSKMHGHGNIVTLSTGLRVLIEYSDTPDGTIRVSAKSEHEPSAAEVTECREFVDSLFAAIKMSPATEWTGPRKL